jgi:hypothetical protein
MGPQTTTTRNQFFHNYLNLEEDWASDEVLSNLLLNFNFERPRKHRHPFLDFWGRRPWTHALLNWWSFFTQQYKTNVDINILLVNRRMRNLNRSYVPLSSWPGWCRNLWVGLKCGEALPIFSHRYFPNLGLYPTTKVELCSTKIHREVHAWWPIQVISTTWEAQIGESWLKCSLGRKLEMPYHKEQVLIMAHACNFSYARKRDRMIAIQCKRIRPCLKNTWSKMDWRCGFSERSLN